MPYWLYQIQTEEKTWISWLGPLTGSGVKKGKKKEKKTILYNSAWFCLFSRLFFPILLDYRPYSAVLHLGFLLAEEVAHCGSTTVTINQTVWQREPF